MGWYRAERLAYGMWRTSLFSYKRIVTRRRERHVVGARFISSAKNSIIVEKWKVSKKVKPARLQTFIN